MQSVRKIFIRPSASNLTFQLQSLNLQIEERTHYTHYVKCENDAHIYVLDKDSSMDSKHSGYIAVGRLLYSKKTAFRDNLRRRSFTREKELKAFTSWEQQGSNWVFALSQLRQCGKKSTVQFNHKTGK